MDNKEGFVVHAIQKRVRNKRRRAPDMYVDVLLSSTVKRLKYELVNEQCERKHELKREISPIPKKKDNNFTSEQSLTKEEIPEEIEVIKAVECLQSTLENLDAEIRNECTGTVATSTIASPGLSKENEQENSKKDSFDVCTKVAAKDETFFESELLITETESNGLTSVSDDVDFDTLMQSLLEICEPLSGNVDDLMKEYSIDPLSSGTFDFLSSNDPFLPGMLEVMCS